MERVKAKKNALSISNTYLSERGKISKKELRERERRREKGREREREREIERENKRESSNVERKTEGYKEKQRGLDRNGESEKQGGEK